MGDNSPVSLLAQRYASAGIREIFAPESKIISERKLWIAVMRAQTKLGHKIEDSLFLWYPSISSLTSPAIFMHLAICSLLSLGKSITPLALLYNSLFTI